MQYLQGWAVQCLNPLCPARGRWLRVPGAERAQCSDCGSPLHSVPPPLAHHFRMRSRPHAAYRPAGRPK
jgi:hypothetical protein